jgi:uncharacterized protein (DUF736 family)
MIVPAVLYFMTKIQEVKMLVEIGALFVKKSKDGNDFLVGKLGNANIFVFKNKHKTNDTQPEYKICIGNGTKSPNKKDESQEILKSFIGKVET